MFSLEFVDIGSKQQVSLIQLKSLLELYTVECVHVHSAHHNYIYIYIYVYICIIIIKRTLVSILVFQFLIQICIIYIKPAAISCTCNSYTF